MYSLSSQADWSSRELAISIRLGDKVRQLWENRLQKRLRIGVAYGRCVCTARHSLRAFGMQQRWHDINFWRKAASFTAGNDHHLNSSIAGIYFHIQQGRNH